MNVKKDLVATLKRVASPSPDHENPSQLLQSCDEFLDTLLPQGFRANPGLELANAFSVKKSALRIQPREAGDGIKLRVKPDFAIATLEASF